VECNCGCGGETSGTAFIPGHDEDVRSAVMYLLGEDTLALCRIFGFGLGLGMLSRSAQTNEHGVADAELVVLDALLLG
jgi:hypothetical protein